MNISELQEFFHTYPPQKEIRLNSSAMILDSSLFLETCILRAQNWPGEVQTCPSYWLLQELYQVCKDNLIKVDAF